MKRPGKGHTPKQYAYAVRKLNGQGRSNKENALIVGFAPSVANNTKRKIESTEGFHNAMIELASKSNNLVLAAMHEYEARGFKDFSNKDLNSALNAISSAWERFNKTRSPNGSEKDKLNPLRKVIMQKVENQTINVAPIKDTPVIKTKEEVDLDF